MQASRPRRGSLAPSSRDPGSGNPALGSGEPPFLEAGDLRRVHLYAEHVAPDLCQHRAHGTRRIQPVPADVDLHLELLASGPPCGRRKKLEMKINVCGTGCIGLVHGAVLAQVGRDVLCVEVDATKIAGLKEGRIPIEAPGFQNPGLEKIVRTNHAEAGSASPPIPPSPYTALRPDGGRGDEHDDLALQLSSVRPAQTSAHGDVTVPRRPSRGRSWFGSSGGASRPRRASRRRRSSPTPAIDAHAPHRGSAAPF